MIDWNKYFEHIYILSGCHNFERREQLENEFKRVGLNNYHWWYNCDNYFIDTNKFANLKSNHIKTSFGHYSLIKTCYELGYENILVCEDDIRFLKDINEIENQLNIFLENKDKCDFYYFDYFILNRLIYNFDCVYINRYAMQFLIYSLEHVGLNMDQNMTTDLMDPNNNLQGWIYYMEGNKYEITIPEELIPLHTKISPIRLCIENEEKLLLDKNYKYTKEDIIKYNIDFI